MAISLDGPVHVDRPVIMTFSAALAFALTAQQSERRIFRLVRDWLPIALVFVAYEYVRGLAKFGIHTSYVLQPRGDRALTGVVPTVWLQHHLYAHGTVHWWDIFPSLFYLSHFLVSFLTLSVLWARAPARFHGYARRLIVVTLVGLVFFALHPTAPPWLAGNAGVIPPVHRTITTGLSIIHLKIAVNAFYATAKTQNAVAAFPSLHAAWSMLPLFVFWEPSRWWLRAVLILYPLGMGFTLILTGEHWLVDILAGYATTAIVCLALPYLERYVAFCATCWLNRDCLLIGSERDAGQRDERG